MFNSRLCPSLMMLVLGLGSCLAAGTRAGAEPPKKADAEAPLFRFNGKDLTGLYGYLHDHKHADPDGVFTVVDGAIRISGKEFGGVTTRDEFSDYRLVAEWKWGEKTWPPRVDRARDSGILLHCQGPDGSYAGQWMEGIECQIIEGGTGDFLVVNNGGKFSLTSETRRGPDGQPYYEKGGESLTLKRGRFNWWGRDPKWKDVIGFRGERDVEKPHGEWNTLEVVCDGDAITVTLNGQVVNVATKSGVTKGKLLFQSEGAEIFFRKIEIWPLRKAE